MQEISSKAPRDSVPRSLCVWTCCTVESQSGYCTASLSVRDHSDTLLRCLPSPLLVQFAVVTNRRSLNHYCPIQNWLNTVPQCI